MASNSSILKTLIYSDIFDYPLAKEELWQFLIGKVDRALFEKEWISFTPLRWECKKGYYFLLGREEIIGKRSKRQVISSKKLKIAKKIIRKLSIVPTVLFIGVSGGLALENSDEKDDIDLFIITSRGTLWITRFILVLLLIIMGQYRGHGKKESQKICLNMLVDEEVLEFKRRDLYTAHEIIQLRPMFNRNNTHGKFLTANRWVLKFLPNSFERFKIYDLRFKKRNIFFIFHFSFLIFGKLAKFIQLIYMKKHRTTEIISDHILAFHPFEYRNYVLKEYNKRLKKYDLPSPRLRRVMPPKLGRNQK